MIRRAITAYFQWCGKHPWIVFWGAILLYLVILIAFFRILFDLRPQYRMLLNGLLAFVTGNFLWLFAIVLILIQGYVRKRSKTGGVLTAVAGWLIFVGLLAAIALPQFGPYATREYDADVKANIRNAATAQAAYYRDNDTYSANIGNLKGFNQSDNVTIAVEATTTTYVIIGTATKRCEANSGVWLIDSTTGAINGTPCRLTRYGLTSFILEGNWP